MALRERERITLVVEEEVVRVMGVRKQEVTRWGSAPLPRHTLKEGLVANPQALAEVVQRLWHTQSQERAMPRQNVLLAIPGHMIPTRIISARNLDTSDIELMRQKAREILPQADSHHVWQLIGTGTQARLFVMATPMALIESYVDPLKRIGLELSAMDIKPLALIRAVGQRHAIIIDVERTLGSIIIVDEALPRRARFPVLQAALLSSAEDKIMRLTEVLYETIHAYNSGNQGQTLHPAVPIFLTGSLAHHELLQDVVQHLLGHPIGTYSPSLNVPSDMPLSQFMVNVGLAKKQLK